jgi:F420-non-reducing hydrogenase iron-sulfur subunit
MSEHNDFEPVIVGFLCNWCSYRAADLAGTSRMKMPSNMRDIRIMCTGRLDPAFVLKALREGADGVLIMGCHPQQCHYAEGNYKAMRRIALLKRTLQQFGLEDGRVRLEWASAAEGPKFAAVVTEMTETIRKLGPLNWKQRFISGNGQGAAHVERTEEVAA